MSDIPSDILRDILLRVPAESLLRLRSVCKQWLRIIDDSSFIKHHTNYQHTNQHTLLLANGNWDTLYFFSLDSLHFINGPQLIDVIYIKLGPRQVTHPIRGFCNSLILMDNEFSRSQLVIWNPLTKEHSYVKLHPQINVTPQCCYAFGYDYYADDYKVVIIDEYCQTYVYSLKSDSWRRIQNCPERIYSLGQTFCNGTLYWPSQDMKMIIALHLRTEIFSEFPLPRVDRSEINITTKIYFYALDGCLICSLNYMGRKTFCGWVMKDNGVKKSWIKLFSLQYCIYMVSSRTLRLVAYLKRKQQVVLEHSRGFLWFDIGANSVKKFSIYGFQCSDCSPICPGSLVRLSVRDSAIGVRDVAAGRISRRKKDGTFIFIK